MHFYLCFFVVSSPPFCKVMTTGGVDTTFLRLVNRPAIMCALNENKPSQIKIYKQFWLDLFFDLSATSKCSENKLNIFKKKFYFINFEFIQVHLIQQKFWGEEKVIKICDESNAKGLSFVVKLHSDLLTICMHCI